MCRACPAVSRMPPHLQKECPPTTTGAGRALKPAQLGLSIFTRCNRYITLYGATSTSLLDSTAVSKADGVGITFESHGPPHAHFSFQLHFADLLRMIQCALASRPP